MPFRGQIQSSREDVSGQEVEISAEFTRVKVVTDELDQECLVCFTYQSASNFRWFKGGRAHCDVLCIVL